MNGNICLSHTSNFVLQNTHSKNQPMLLRLTPILFLFLLSLNLAAQQPNTARQLPATRTAAAFKIDGTLDEAAWKEAAPAKDFTEWRPAAGKPEEAFSKTIVYILYDNTSIYIGGYCYEKTMDSVSRELVGRDVVGVNDFVGVIFD